MQDVQQALFEIAQELFDCELEPELVRPESEFGDYSTNIAMQLAAKTHQPPQQIANDIKARLEKLEILQEVQVAGPGFLNLRLKDSVIWQTAAQAAKLPQPLAGQEILVEFGDPNPFKEMHIGHLYSYIVGDSIARLLESAGASPRHLSYHGDVGLHVAKAIWGMQHSDIDFQASADSVGQNIGMYYTQGSLAYEKDEAAAKEIHKINEHIYRHDDAHVDKLYEWGKQKSFAYFDNILAELDIKNDKKYLESQSADLGLQLVKQHLGQVFIQSQGAVVYPGEKVGLHTRVFITSQGLPTYETKDLGLAELKSRDYPDASRSIVITAHEQIEYFKVMLAALKEFDEDLAAKTTHLAHGFVSLSSGKMSSRTGEVYSARELMANVEDAVKKLYPNSRPEIYQAAIRYAFLKHRLGSDIVYDINESISLEGNSGPYLQYAYARARSILQKAGSSQDDAAIHLEPAERRLAHKIGEYPEVVSRATSELMPHHVANYLYELAQTFNRFYESNRVMADPRQTIRSQLVKTYADVLASGLGLLNIETPERV